MFVFPVISSSPMYFSITSSAAFISKIYEMVTQTKPMYRYIRYDHGPMLTLYRKISVVDSGPNYPSPPRRLVQINVAGCEPIRSSWPHSQVNCCRSGLMRTTVQFCWNWLRVTACLLPCMANWTSLVTWGPNISKQPKRGRSKTGTKQTNKQTKNQFFFIIPTFGLNSACHLKVLDFT